MSVPDLSIGIVNWNTRAILRGCLESLAATAGEVNAEIVVVDNGSTDGSQEMLAAGFPSVRVIANRENQGFAAANNQAIDQTTGRIVLFLNSDTVMRPGVLPAIIRHFDDHPEAGAVGCGLLNVDGSPQRSSWRGYVSLRFALIDALYLWRLMPGSRFVQRSDVTAPEGAPYVQVDHLLGACLAVPRRVLRESGGFDGRFFMFLEETDLCYRIKERGYEIHFLPGPKIVHYGGQSTKQVAAMKRILYQSQLRFLRKHGARRSVLIAYKGVTALAAAIRIALWSCRWLRGPDRRSAARSIAAYGLAIVDLARS